MQNSNTEINIMIADDHQIFRDGLCGLLSSIDFIKNIVQSENGKQLIAQPALATTDIILLDIKMPIMDGIEAAHYIHQRYPRIGIIALSMFDEDDLIIEMLDAGAKGYLLKNANKEEIIDAIISVHSGTHYYCKTVNEKIKDILHNKKTNSVYYLNPSFSDRELEVIAYICLEYTAKEIADKMGLSFRTIEGYKKKVQEKLNVKNSVGVAIYALKHKLVDPSKYV